MTFFNTYKDLEGKQTEIIGWQGRADAWRIIAECRAAYQGAGALNATRSETRVPEESSVMAIDTPLGSH